MADRCTGHCCASFYLPFSPAELTRAFAAWWRGDETWVDDAGAERGPTFEIEIIAPMVIHLGWLPQNPVETYVCRLGPDVHEPGESHFYTCRNFDFATNNCRIYDRRPFMCRDYPYGNGCHYVDCAWSSARRERQEVAEREQASVLDDLNGGG